MIRALAAAVAAMFLVGCAVMPVSYVPTTGKVGSQRGRACVFKLMGLIPFGNEMGQLARAADAAGNRAETGDLGRTIIPSPQGDPHPALDIQISL